MSDDNRFWPRFSPEINFGHLLQAAVVLLTIGTGAITSYLSLRSDIQQVRADLTVKVSEHELRIVTIEHAIDDQHREEHEFQTEMRSAISRVTDLLSDVRVQLGRRLQPHG
jgi:phage-related minor tail protein